MFRFFYIQMKKFFRNIHLYLSLVAGLFIMIACLTGSILVFEEEITHFIHANRYKVQVKAQQLPLSTLVKIAEEQGKKMKFTSAKISADEDKSIEINIAAKEEKTQTEKKKSNAPALTIYLNPYTGQVLDVENKRASFFKKVEMIHRFLLSKKEGVGHYIMSYSSLFFLFILATGLILWWPKSKKVLQQRLKIKWDAKTKRLTHDLHVVTGFYTSVFLIVIVMTGLVMSFNWINKGIFTLTGSNSENPKPPQSVAVNDAKMVSLNELQKIIATNFKAAETIYIRMPKDNKDVISVNVLQKKQAPNTTDTYYLNQYTGKVLGSLAFADKNTGQKIRSYIKPIHTGEIFGITSKIISFIIVLLTLTFPVTGVLMWLKRIKKI